MTNYNTVSSNLKRGIVNFSERISRGLTRPESKFISQMIYGILSAQSCHLSKIARELSENITLKKVIDRLSRNLGSFENADFLFMNYIKKVKGALSDKTLLVVDGGDITKPCSKKMEHMARVHDGSTGGTGDGYWTLAVTALTSERKMPIGVYTRVYSQAEPDFISEDEEVLKALNFLSRNFKRKNIRVFDRGYDANIYYERLTDKRESFVIRAKKNRSVIYKGVRVNIMSLAKSFKGKYSLKFNKKNGMEADLKISVIPVRLPCRPDTELNLVMCYGFGQEPLLLLTNLRSDDKRISIVITKVYILRWRIEEFYRFKKQQFDFEDFRVRSLKSIRNLDLLLTIAIGYIGLMSEKGDEYRMKMELIEVSKRIKGVPKFTFYAMADGMHFILAKTGKGIGELIRPKPKTMQLSLFDFPHLCWSG